MTILIVIASGIGGVLLALLGYIGYQKWQARPVKTKQSKPRFKSATAGTGKGTASYTPASKAIVIGDSFRRIDEVLGEITVDGIEYTTFDAGEVYIYDKKKNPVIAFKIDGYGNEQRSINYIKVSEHVEKSNGVIFYVKHNQNDFALFNDWLNEQMYGGDYTREALRFKDLMEEVGKFNQLLASRKLRRTTGKYVAY